MRTPTVHELVEVLDALGEWQHDEGPMQLHPGDIGWFWRFGGEATAAAVRTWGRHGRIEAVGLLDGPGLLRMTTAPDLRQDEGLAGQIVTDVCRVDRGLLGPGTADVEVPADALVRDLLAAAGWGTGESFTPLRHGLSGPVTDQDLRTEVVGPSLVPVRVALQQGSFDRSSFTDERWWAMAEGPAYDGARCLVVHDAAGAAVGAATVWSADPGRPGLVEPLGVHRDHRGHGYGTAIALAAAQALQELGSSCALVGTPTVNVPAVAAYESAGFERLPEVCDLSRP